MIPFGVVHKTLLILYADCSAEICCRWLQEKMSDGRMKCRVLPLYIAADWHFSHEETDVAEKRKKLRVSEVPFAIMTYDNPQYPENRLF
jgi:hypothetical protein